MEAHEQRVQKVLEGNKQFLVPHYQRPYTWSKDDWNTLWNDLEELREEPDAPPHFIGSIVTAPARTIPEGVEKRLLIDGQQRLTTIMVLLGTMRDRARAVDDAKLAEKIQDHLTNRHEDGLDHFRLLPTEGETAAESDQHAFLALIRREPVAGTSRVVEAVTYFQERMRTLDGPALDDLYRRVTTRLTLVSIVLNEKDNPHRIFESLNGKGRPLSQADLIRNYFFMRLDAKDHEHIYKVLWRPMQQRLGEEHLTEFVRHYLTKSEGAFVKASDVYATLKLKVDADTSHTLEHLKDLVRHASYYSILLEPANAPTPDVRSRLQRIARWEVSVAYPFLLGAYADYAEGKLSEPEFCAVLDVLETYLVRRFVCGVQSRDLNKILSPLYAQASRGDGFVTSVRRILGARQLPRDGTFRRDLAEAKLYGQGDRVKKTKLILERLELAHGHKERVATETLSIEHVMPQTPTDWWKQHLGDDWEEDHEQLLHTLGNLTLTGYNSDLSNSSYPVKREHLVSKSHVELNGYFGGVEHWRASDIERRADVLAEQALSVWPDFAPARASEGEVVGQRDDVTGTVPRKVRLQGADSAVQSWADVQVWTFERLMNLGPDAVESILDGMAKVVNRDPSAFKRARRLHRLPNGALLELNFSAIAIFRHCTQAVQLAGLSTEDWEVEYDRVTDDDEGASSSASTTEIKSLQHELWQQVREALAVAGTFPSLRAARPQYWFDLAIGRSGAELSLTANMATGFAGVKLSLYPPLAEEMLPRLVAQKAAIEQELGRTLQWDPYPAKKVRTIKLTTPMSLVDRSSWPAAIAWFTDTAAAFKRAFVPRVVNDAD